MKANWTAIAILTGFSALASAAEPTSPPPDRAPGAMRERLVERLKAADKDGDGFLSKAEVQASMPRLAARFDELDTNKDGKLSIDELRAARPAGRPPAK